MGPEKGDAALFGGRKELRPLFPDSVPSPFEFYAASKPYIDKAADFVMQQRVARSKPGSLGGVAGAIAKCEPIDIFGMSRGAVFAVLLTQELEKRGALTIRFVGLIDAVSSLIGDMPLRPEGGNLKASPIVRTGHHAMKNPKAERWPRWSTWGADLTTLVVDGIASQSYPFTIRQALSYNPRKTTIHQHMGVERAHVRANLMDAAKRAGVVWG